MRYGVRKAGRGREHGAGREEPKDPTSWVGNRGVQASYGPRPHRAPRVFPELPKVASSTACGRTALESRL